MPHSSKSTLATPVIIMGEPAGSAAGLSGATLVIAALGYLLVTACAGVVLNAWTTASAPFTATGAPRRGTRGLAPRIRRAGSALSAPLDATLRLMRQRRRVAVSADRLLWRVGTTGLLAAAVLKVAVIPLVGAPVLSLGVGVVWFNTMDVLAWALVWLAGWGANSTYSLVAGNRFLAHAIAYELPLMFSLVAPALAARSLDVARVGASQGGVWNIVWMPVAFAVYCIGVLGFSVWGPFSAALGVDVAGGVSAELSGIDRWSLLCGRYALLAAGALFAVPMFLGGGSGPGLPAALWVLVKALAVLALLLWLGRRLPLVRPDLFMEVGWMVLLPAALAQDLLVAVVKVVTS